MLMVILHSKKNEFPTIIIEIIWFCHTSHIYQSIYSIICIVMELFIHTLKQALSLSNMVERREINIKLFFLMETIVWSLRSVYHKKIQKLSNWDNMQLYCILLEYVGLHNYIDLNMIASEHTFLYHIFYDGPFI